MVYTEHTNGITSAAYDDVVATKNFNIKYTCADLVVSGQICLLEIYGATKKYI